MEMVLTAVDRVVRSLAPVDAIVSLAARQLLPQTKAAACPSIYCGRFCEYHGTWGQCSGNQICWVVDWYAYDSFQPCPHDCANPVGCCTSC